MIDLFAQKKKGFVLPCIMKRLHIDYFLYILCVRVDCLRVRSGPFFLPLFFKWKSNKQTTKALGHEWCSLQVAKFYYFIHDALVVPPSHACKLQNNQYYDASNMEWKEIRAMTTWGFEYSLHKKIGQGNPLT
jgi:hypothetical protein